MIEHRVVAARGELVEQAEDIVLLAVLQHVVGAVDHLVGIAEGVPVGVLQRRGVAVGLEPDREREVRIELERRVRIVGGEMQVGRDDLVFARLAAARGEMAPGLQRLEHGGLVHGGPPEGS